MNYSSCKECEDGWNIPLGECSNVVDVRDSLEKESTWEIYKECFPESDEYYFSFWHPVGWNRSEVFKNSIYSEKDKQNYLISTIYFNLDDSFNLEYSDAGILRILDKPKEMSILEFYNYQDYTSNPFDLPSKEDWETVIVDNRQGIIMPNVTAYMPTSMIMIDAKYQIIELSINPINVNNTEELLREIIETFSLAD